MFGLQFLKCSPVETIHPLVEIAPISFRPALQDYKQSRISPLQNPTDFDIRTRKFYQKSALESNLFVPNLALNIPQDCFLFQCGAFVEFRLGFGKSQLDLGKVVFYIKRKRNNGQISACDFSLPI